MCTGRNQSDVALEKTADVQDGQRCPSQRRLLRNAPCEIAAVNHGTQQDQCHLAQLCGDDARVIGDRLLRRLNPLVHKRNSVVSANTETPV